MVKEKDREIVFKIESTNLTKIINVIRDLSSITDKAMFKFNNKNLLMYSSVGEGNAINAFKSYVFNITEIFNHSNIEFEINYIAHNIKNIVKSLTILNNMVSPEEEIICKIHYDILGDVYYSDVLTFKIDKLKLQFNAGDPLSINTSITVEKIKDIVNIDNSLFNFDLLDTDFTSVKRFYPYQMWMKMYFI